MHSLARWPDGISVVWRELTWGEYQRFQASPLRKTAVALEVYRTVVVRGPCHK